MDKAQIFDLALVTLGPVLLAALGWGFRLLTQWLSGKVKNQRIAGAILQLDDLALVVVKSVYQSYVKPLKASGEWTAERHAEAKRLAVEELKSYLGGKGLKLLGEAFSGDVAAALGGFVESAVHDNKKAGTLLEAKTAAVTASAGALPEKPKPDPVDPS